MQSHARTHAHKEQVSQQRLDLYMAAGCRVKVQLRQRSAVDTEQLQAVLIRPSAGFSTQRLSQPG